MWHDRAISLSSGLQDPNRLKMHALHTCGERTEIVTRG